MCFFCTIQELRIISCSSISCLCISPSDVLRSGPQICWDLHGLLPLLLCCGCPPQPFHSHTFRTSPNVPVALLYVLVQNSTGFLCLKCFEGLYKFQLLVNICSPFFHFFFFFFENGSVLMLRLVFPLRKKIHHNG